MPYRSNWEELPKYQTLDKLSAVNYQVTVTNTGSRSGAIAVLAYMTFTVCPTPLHHQSITLLLCIGSQCTNEAAVWISTS